MTQYEILLVNTNEQVAHITDIVREKCPNTELFLVRVSCIRTEYGYLQSKSPYSVPIQENKDQK